MRSAFKSQANYSFEKEQKDITPFQAWRSGFITNMTNPMVLVLFLSIFSTVIQESTPLLVQGLFMAEVLLISLAWFVSVAILFSVPIIRKGFQKLGPWLDVGTGVILIGLAGMIMYQAWTSFSVPTAGT